MNNFSTKKSLYMRLLIVCVLATGAQNVLPRDSDRQWYVGAQFLTGNYANSETTYSRDCISAIRFSKKQPQQNLRPSITTQINDNADLISWLKAGASGKHGEEIPSCLSPEFTSKILDSSTG